MPDARIPRILDHAPNFEAQSTHGLIKLSDYTMRDTAATEEQL